jgi:dihydroorotase
MKIAIKNGHLVDPLHGIDRAADLYIADGRVVAVGDGPADFDAERTIDAAGLIVCPGLIDLSARVGSLESELAAALAGGITTVVCPPDTDPPMDEPELAERLVRKVADLGLARVLPLGALTQRLAGERLAEMVGLTRAGCVALSQGKTPVVDTQALLRAFEYASTFGFAIWLQAQDPYLSRDGVAHDGEVAARLGLAGIPVSAETVALTTYLQLAADTGVRLHLRRLSSAAGIAMVQRAQAGGLPVSCDVGIHHLHLSEKDIGYFDAQARFDPPLRADRDRAALRAGVLAGHAAICSDHTPLDDDDKLLPFDEAKPGATGLELLLPLTLQLAAEEKQPLTTAIARLTCDPARILGVDLGQLGVGAVADVCLFRPEDSWRVTRASLRSQGKNTPFLGYELSGRAVATLVGGKQVFEA